MGCLPSKKEILKWSWRDERAWLSTGWTDQTRPYWGQKSWCSFSDFCFCKWPGECSHYRSKIVLEWPNKPGISKQFPMWKSVAGNLVCCYQEHHSALQRNHYLKCTIIRSNWRTFRFSRSSISGTQRRRKLLWSCPAVLEVKAERNYASLLLAFQLWST